MRFFKLKHGSAKRADDTVQVAVELDHTDVGFGRCAFFALASHGRFSIVEFRAHSEAGFEAVDVLRVAAEEFAAVFEVLDEFVGFGYRGAVDRVLEFGDKGVENGGGDFVLEEVGVKEVFALDDGVRVLLLDEVVESICRAKVLCVLGTRGSAFVRPKVLLPRPNCFQKTHRNTTRNRDSSSRNDHAAL